MEIKLKEHYFTSSRQKGGFFTLDHSPSLSKEEVDELERKGLYSPPQLLDPGADKAQIEHLFPETFAFYKLKSSNHFVFSHANYTGVSNHSTHRFGNFFTHSLVMVDSELTVPVKLIFDRLNFKQALSLDEDDHFKPSLNPHKVLAIENIDDALSQLFSYFCAFFSKEHGRLNFFAKIFDFIISGKIAKKGYNLTIVDRKENLSDWVMAVNYFLPRKVANNIGFASYVDNPDSPNYPFEITGIVKECGITDLPEPYFTLLNPEHYRDYQPKQLYTNHLISIINTADFTNWQDMVRALDEFDLIQIDGALDTPLKFLAFKKDIKSQTLERLGAMLSELDLQKKASLRGYVAQENRELYMALLQKEISQIVTDVHNSVNRKWQSFYNLYEAEILKSPAELSDKLLWFFWDKFTGDDRSRIALLILLNLECAKKTFFKGFLSSADLYFENMSNDTLKNEDILKLTNRYTLSSTPKEIIPNILAAKQAIEQEQKLKTAGIKEIENKYLNLFTRLSREEAGKKLMDILNREFKKPFDGTFLPYINFVEKIVPDDTAIFWHRFFEDNVDEKYRPPGRHSLIYLKKKFTVDIFCRKPESIALTSHLNFSHEEALWIKDQIKEFSTEPSRINLFLDQYNKSLRSGSKRFWGL